MSAAVIADSSRVAVRCRPLAPADHDSVAELLARGFPDHDRAFWDSALTRLDRHRAAQPIGHAGYVLQAGSAIVGILLMINRRVVEGDRAFTLCNLSSWFVEDAFRSFAPLLVKAATRDKTVTYLNISPARSTEASVEAQGFVRFCTGIHIGLPLLSRAGDPNARCHPGSDRPEGAVHATDIELLHAHAELGCMSVWCEADGQAHPFVFTVGRRFRNLVPAAHLVYCSDPDLVSRFARPLGRFLARRGILAMSADANAPVPNLPGRFRTDDTPKYYKGPHRPRLGDLAYTETALFGI